MFSKQKPLKCDMCHEKFVARFAIFFKIFLNAIKIIFLKKNWPIHNSVKYCPIFKILFPPESL